MMHLNLIVLGKLKEKYWVTAEAEYLKRLQSFAKVKILELKEESFLKKDNFEIVKQKEADKIKKIIPANSFLIVLDSKGKEFTSEDFSIKLQQLEQSGQYNSLTFIIGGPLGLDKEILNLADLKLSFSAMTFTHQMIRIFLLEQIYRGFMIKENRQYHY